MLKLVGLLIISALMAFGADVTGSWKAEYTTPDGTQRQSTFNLKADGDKLTGKVVSAMGETDIQNGSIKGDDVSFSVVRNFNGNDVTLKYSGKVSGDEMKLKVSFNDEQSFDIVAKRQKT
jgi:hypothetical protein